MTLRIVRSGTWLYDEIAPLPVDIVGLDYDFWYGIGEADGHLERTEEPTPLPPSGFLYYVRFRHAGETAEPTWVDSLGHPTPEHAMADAEKRVPSPISWEIQG